MDGEIQTSRRPKSTPWNNGRITGQKRPLKPKDVWAIRIRLQLKCALNRHPLTRNRKFVDSPLEGDGFELPVRERGQSVCRPHLSYPAAWDGSVHRSDSPLEGWREMDANLQFLARGDQFVPRFVRCCFTQRPSVSISRNSPPPAAHSMSAAEKRTCPMPRTTH